MADNVDDRLPIVDNEQLPPALTASSSSTRRNVVQDNELDPEPTGCGGSAFCNPTSGLHRFIALNFMCLLGFGKLLSALQNKTKTKNNTYFTSH